MVIKPRDVGHQTYALGGYLSTSSAQGLQQLLRSPAPPPPGDGSAGTSRSARHTALLHLNPDPKPICHTRWPRRTRPLASAYASSYHSELLLVLPNRWRADLLGSMSESRRLRLRCTSSSTARPPACTQKCSNARRKSGM